MMVMSLVELVDPREMKKENGVPRLMWSRSGRTASRGNGRQSTARFSMPRREQEAVQSTLTYLEKRGSRFVVRLEPFRECLLRGYQRSL